MAHHTGGRLVILSEALHSRGEGRRRRRIPITSHPIVAAAGNFQQNSIPLRELADATFAA